MMDTTFLLLAYNQEAYVGDAVRSALMQEGDPLAIFISDDASTDGTFEAIQQAVREYRGPHQVIINRNHSNLGIADHLNACMRMITTDFVIAAAADDVSLPHRAKRLRERFVTSGALLLHSRFREIDKNGSFTHGCFPLKSAYFLRDTSPLKAACRMGLYVGATGAWHRVLFDRYGKLPSGCPEDLILGFRASLELGVGFVDEELVLYRIDTGVSADERRTRGIEGWRDRRIKNLTRTAVVLQQRLLDTIVSTHPEKAILAVTLAKQLRRATLRLENYQGGGYRGLPTKTPAQAIVAAHIAFSEWGKYAIAKLRNWQSSRF